MITDDVELVYRARAGSTEAFSSLVMLHQRYVYNLALRTLGDAHEAEDLAQEVFLRAWQSLPRFRGEARFSTWLYRIAINLCYNRLPNLRRDLEALGQEDLDGTPDESLPDPARSAENDERIKFVHQQVNSLPESYRLLISLRYQQGLAYDEIASLLNLPLGTVKTGLFRAHALLRQRLKQFLFVNEEEAVWVS